MSDQQQATRIAEAPYAEDLPGNRLALTIIIPDPKATEAKNFAEERGMTVAEWLQEQIEHALTAWGWPWV